jgi:hypothetical protein
MDTAILDKLRQDPEFMEEVENEYRETFFHGIKPRINTTAETLVEYKRALYHKRMQIRQAIINHTIRPTNRVQKYQGKNKMLVIIKRIADKMLLPLADGKWGKYDL